MIHRFVAVSLSLALVVGIASGCTPEPAPTPSATGFASEEEAFAAAEETYRAYVDALNQVDLSDPETFEAVYAWTTGEANAGAKKSFTQMHADGWTVEGESGFDNFTPTDFESDGTASKVTADVCLDVTDVQVTDSAGKSMVPATRKDRQPAVVTFVEGETTTGLTIATSDATDAQTCD